MRGGFCNSPRMFGKTLLGKLAAFVAFFTLVVIVIAGTGAMVVLARLETQPGSSGWLILGLLHLHEFLLSIPFTASCFLVERCSAIIFYWIS